MRTYPEFIKKMYRIDAEYGLKFHESQLLDIASIAHLQDELIRVGDLIGQKSIASQATLHNSLKQLIKKGFLQTKPDAIDRRSRIVVLTKDALKRHKILQLEFSKSR
ncbi:MarR family transcriptional regulator [Polynucleobacter sp. Ross1-W9]|uniref:winged helix DNA-binding protein n=1 Tax=Polynucleobacter parvulilacunae TaxID=1855631 RepID=UPI001C0E3445|nr:winged helix DNA-binding protein [Polynucleobacter parvulilacunae]MBU3556215.1 MarR family transcriptional regulator [Polynucleobacter parvulilacunae]